MMIKRYLSPFIQRQRPPSIWLQPKQAWLALLLILALTGCQLVPANNAEQTASSPLTVQSNGLVPAEQLIAQHYRACELNAVSVASDIDELPSFAGTEPSSEVEIIVVPSEQERRLQSFLSRFCQHSYRNPADTSEALAKLLADFDWPNYVLQYLALLDQQLLYHRKALSARAILRKRGEKADLDLTEAIETLKQTSANLEQTLSSLAKSEQELLLRQLGKGDDVDNKPGAKPTSQTKDKSDNQNKDQEQ